jgi:hypothetical protein
MAKIDVEGFEPRVIDGAKECLSTGVSDAVLLEINAWTQQRSGQSPEACFTKMMNCGFEYAYMPTNEGYQRIERAGDPWPVNNTFLFTRRELSEVLHCRSAAP